MLTFGRDWSVSVKSGVGCGGLSSPPAKPPLPPVTVKELEVPCSWLCPLPPPQAEAVRAASRATNRGPRLIVPKIPGASSFGLRNRLGRPPRHGCCAHRPGDPRGGPDAARELEPHPVRGHAPFATG